VGDTIELIGLTLLSTLNCIEKENLWDSLPNLSLILSMYVFWLPNFDDAMDINEQNWIPGLVAYAEKHDMKIEGIYGIEHAVAKFPSDELEEAELRKIKKAASKDKHGFKHSKTLSRNTVEERQSADPVSISRR